MDELKFGSFYIDGQPEFSMLCPDLRSRYTANIAFGNTVEGREMPWVKLGDLFVATKCACTGISWSDLNERGYIFGYPVQIDGRFYLCRSLQVGTAKDCPNEWNACLDAYGDSESFWNWNKLFWGQETSKGNYAERIVRGMQTARARSAFLSITQSGAIGFRPVLEPLDPMPEDISCFIGKCVWIYGPQGSRACGVLTSIDDYDLVLGEASGPFPIGGSQWIRTEGATATMAKSSMVWIKEKQKHGT